MRRTSSETIYDELKGDIIFLRLKPGEEISQADISEKFDVSRSPVRDALMRLRSEGLVVMRPQRGCWVSRIDLSRVDDECFFRLALEKSVIDRYREYMKASDLTRLEYFIALLARQTKCLDEKVLEYRSSTLLPGNEQKVIDIIKELNGAGYGDISKQIPDMKPNTLRRILRHLQSLHIIEKHGEGKGSWYCFRRS